MAVLGYLSEEQFADLVNAAASSGGAVASFNTRTGAVALTSGDVTTALTFTPYNATNPSGYITGINSSMVTTALGYTPTSVTGLTGAQSVAAFKTGLTLVKADVGLGSVDNTSDAGKPVSTAQQTALDLKLDDSQAGTFGLTLLGSANLAAAKASLVYVKADVGLGSADNTADAAKNVLSATVLATPRNINGVAFDGSANITINAVDSTARVPETRTISTTAPLTGGGDLSANRTFAISAASGAAAGSMSAADKTSLDGLLAAWTGYTPTVTAQAGTFTTASATGRYKQVGKTVFVRITVTITTNGTASGSFIVTAPVNSVNSADTGAQQAIPGKETGATGQTAMGQLINNSNQIYVSKYDGTYLGADGYVINLSGCYEAA